MLVNFAAVIKDIKGKPIKEPPTDGSTGESVDYTLGAVACTALLNPYVDEQNLPPVEKIRRFRLAQKASDGGEQDVSVEDVAELKKLIGKAFPPLVVGRAFEILDPGLQEVREPQRREPIRALPPKSDLVS